MESPHTALAVEDLERKARPEGARPYISNKFYHFIIASTNCLTTSVNDIRSTGVSLISNYPNPFTQSTTISFTTKGGHTLIQIIDTLGRVISTPVDRDYTPGNYKISFDSYGLPTGIYYLRFQNGITQQVKGMLKAR